MNFKVVFINILFLFAFLLTPPYALSFYKFFKNINKSQLEKNTLLNHLDKKDVDKILLVKDEEKDIKFIYKSFIGWELLKKKGKYLNILGEYKTRQSPNQNLRESTWFFGGSTIFGLGVSDIETIPSHYAALSEEEVMNFGVPDWDSRQSLNKLINVIGDGYTPKRIIFYDGMNDIMHHCREDLNKEKLPHHNRQLVFSEAISNYETPNNIFFHLQDNISNLKEFLIRPYKLFFYKIGIAENSPYISSDQLLIQSSCLSNPDKANLVAKHLINNWYVAYQIAESKNISFLGVLQPNLYSTKSIYYDYMIDKYRSPNFKKIINIIYPLIKKEIKDSCKYSLKFCDSLIDGSKWISSSERVFMDTCHLTSKGNLIIAETFDKFINLKDIQN